MTTPRRKLIEVALPLEAIHREASSRGLPSRPCTSATRSGSRGRPSGNPLKSSLLGNRRESKSSRAAASGKNSFRNSRRKVRRISLNNWSCPIALSHEEDEKRDRSPPSPNSVPGSRGDEQVSDVACLRVDSSGNVGSGLAHAGFPLPLVHCDVPTRVAVLDTCGTRPEWPKAT